MAQDVLSVKASAIAAELDLSKTEITTTDKEKKESGVNPSENPADTNLKVSETESEETGFSNNLLAETEIHSSETPAKEKKQSGQGQPRKLMNDSSIVGKWSFNVLRICLKMVLLGAVFLYSWKALTPYFRVDRNTDGDLMRNLPENSIDVLALGSSHIQYAFNPGVFSAETGYYSYVFGSVCQPFSESYYLLKEFLKTQSPEVVILDIFTLLPQSQVCYADGTYYIAMDMMEGENRIDSANGIPDTVDEETTLGYKYDLYMNHDNWKTMDLSDPESIAHNAEKPEDMSWSLGYVAQEPEVFQYTPLWLLEPEKISTVSEREAEWIDKIADLCEENNIHLVFVKTPYIEDQDDANKMAGIWQYIDEKGLEYIDFLARAEELEWFIDMDGDTWHNNTWGAEIVTKELARYIQEKGYVKHHKENEELKPVYEDAEKATAYYLMNPANINVYRLVEEAAKYPCTVFFRYQGRNNTSLGEFENNALQEMGLNHDFLTDKNKNYYAVLHNGELLEDSDVPFETEWNGKSIQFTKDDILVDGASLGQVGDMQIIIFDNEGNWVNPLAIDYASPSGFWKKGCNVWDCE